MEIFIDIETKRTSRTDIVDRICADLGPPSNYKKPETIAQWWASEGDLRKQEAIDRTALDGTWGEVICIGFAVDNQDVAVICESNEAATLETFCAALPSLATDKNWYQSIWIGHNILDFDLRFLWQRSIVQKVKFPFCMPLGKPAYNRGPYSFDTMKEWAGWKGGIKQTDLELAFGLERKDPLKGGAEVGKAYQEGRLEDIKAHCRQDVTLLREIYRRMVA